LEKSKNPADDKWRPCDDEYHQADVEALGLGRYGSASRLCVDGTMLRLDPKGFSANSRHQSSSWVTILLGAQPEEIGEEQIDHKENSLSSYTTGLGGTSP